MRVKIFLAGVLLYLTVAVTASGDGIASDFAAKLREQSVKIETIQCSFTQTRHLSVLTADAVSSGRFHYKREGNICLEFDEPQGDMIVMRTDRFKIVSQGKKNVVPISSNPMLKQLKSMLTACMTGDIKLLEAGSDVDYQEVDEGYRLTISPTNRKTRSQVAAIVLTFDRDDMSLVRLRMEETSGDYTEYTFREKKFNLPVDDAVFDI